MRKTIYMSEPLTRLAEETRGDSRRTSGFSRRLGEIVERYQIMLDIDAELALGQVAQMTHGGAHHVFAAEILLDRLGLGR